MSSTLLRSLALLLLSALALPIAGLASESNRPNVVLIISDDQAWTDYGFMGHPHLKTPHLDQLARESLVFKRGYATTSLCCPSLAAVLTGRAPHINKVTGNEPPAPSGNLSGKELDPDGRPLKRYANPAFLAQVKEMNAFITQHPRIPVELGKLGYRSLQTGKWWAGHYKSGGFTHGMSHGDQATGGRHGDDGLAIGRKTMQPIYDFIAEGKDQPFFLWYAPMLPHDPHNAPEALVAKYRSVAPSEFVAKYWANVEWFDQTVGQLMSHLDEKGLRDNTIVLYITDNGWIQSPDKKRFQADSKLSQYDAGLRTPVMIRWPGKVQPRTDEKTLVSLLDIAPTIYGAVSAPRPDGLPGVNLLDSAALSSRHAIHGACFLHNAVDLHQPASNLTWRWCIQEDYKLIVPNPRNIKQSPRSNIAKDAIELYHITADPHEKSNLASQEPDRVKQLREVMNQWWNPAE